MYHCTMDGVHTFEGVHYMPIKSAESTCEVTGCTAGQDNTWLQI